MVNCNKNILHILFFFLSLSFTAQKIKFIETYNENGFIEKKKSNDNNSINIINEVYLSNIENGYLNTAIDSFRTYNKTLYVYINNGDKLKNSKIKIKVPDEIDLEFTQGFEKKGDNFNPIEFRNKINKWLLLMNNNGFPFAEFEFNKSSVQNSNIELNCNLKTGPYVIIDTLINPEIDKKEWRLISNITGIKKGSAFNLNSIYDITKKLKRTGYVEELKPAAYEFTEDLASIYTYTRLVSKNTLNGLVGIQPSETGKIQFTGNISLNFLNSLKYGEQLKINWRRMFNASQNLITEFNLPYLFNSNFQISGGIDMIKKDSSFFNLSSKFIFEYLIKNNISLGALISNNNSTNLLKNNYSSTSINSFGFTFKNNRINNNKNPSKGYSISSDFAYGWKQTYNLDTNRNNVLRTPNFYGNLDFKSFFKIFKRSTLKFGLMGSSIQNEIIYENEFSRIGGYKTIRGFDEESIWVSSFLITNLELRYLIDETSNLFIFSDFAWTESKTQESLINNYYNSIGFGTNISMSNGMLTLIYGLGRKFDNPFLIRTGKIHLGFTSFF